MNFRLGSSVLWLYGPAAVLGAAANLHLIQSVAAQEPAPVQSVTVRAHKYSFEPGRIEVREGDVVQVSFRAEDIAHSFVIDAYRIAKRAGPGKTITFEFRADVPGTFPFYCDLRADDGCRRMHGELIVRRR
jgi:heme/copper-type cytochrome/quinol oxidase subunit 2